MGASSSRFLVLDYAENRNHSTEHNINEWEAIPPKNDGYYSGERFFTVPLHLYPSHTRGWFW
tara:strand:- start:56 stop:241 length:186 start_codon:yes stop_codon:yes gene_type:complete